MTRHDHLATSAGLLAGPCLWAANTQFGLILPYAECATRIPASALLSAALAVLTLVSAWISARAPGFFGRVGAVMGLVFAMTLLLQALSGALLTGCER